MVIITLSVLSIGHSMTVCCSASRCHGQGHILFAVLAVKLKYYVKMRGGAHFHDPKSHKPLEAAVNQLSSATAGMKQRFSFRLWPDQSLTVLISQGTTLYPQCPAEAY